MRVKVTNDCGFKLDIKVNGKLDRASWKLIFDLANDNTIDKTRIDSELILIRIRNFDGNAECL